MANPVIQCINLGKTYNADNQVSGIEFSVNSGECLALCGGNGAGKSTIMKMIVGLLPPTTGEIRLAGYSSKEEGKRYKEQFGYMPDSMLFPKSLTGYEALHFFARLRKLPAARITDVLDLVGLQHAGNKKISDYSKGMQQRLSLAQALLANPPILILDEPTNGLDPLWVVRFKQLIMDLKKAGTTILLSSHIMRDVEELADRVAFIHAGKLIKTGEVKELCNRSGKPQKLEDVFFQMISEVS